MREFAFFPPQRSKDSGIFFSLIIGALNWTIISWLIRREIIIFIQWETFIQLLPMIYSKNILLSLFSVSIQPFNFRISSLTIRIVYFPFWNNTSTTKLKKSRCAQSFQKLTNCKILFQPVSSFPDNQMIFREE